MLSFPRQPGYLLNKRSVAFRPHLTVGLAFSKSKIRKALRKRRRKNSTVSHHPVSTQEYNKFQVIMRRFQVLA